MTTTETETTVARIPEGPVQISDVEGHPIYCDTKDSGKLYGVVNGKRIEHKTYSTLRRIMYQEHVRGLSALDALIVKIPDARYYRYLPSFEPAKLVAKDSVTSRRGSETEETRRLIASNDFRYDEGIYAVIPTDSGEDTEAIQETLRAFAAEVKAEDERHQAAEREIIERARSWAEALRERFPESAVFDRLPDLHRDSDRSASYHDRYRR